MALERVSGPRFQMTIAAECDKVGKCAVQANDQNFDRLEAELAIMA